MRIVLCVLGSVEFAWCVRECESDDRWFMVGVATPATISNFYILHKFNPTFGAQNTPSPLCACCRLDAWRSLVLAKKCKQQATGP